MADLSFEEKSLWLQLLGVGAVFAGYFLLALGPVPRWGSDLNPQHVGLFIAAVVLLVVLQVLGHVLAALHDRRAALVGPDERDRLIALRGSRSGGFVLASAVFAALCTAVVVPGNFASSHVLLAGWVLAQLAETGMQLWHHRFGV